MTMDILFPRDIQTPDPSGHSILKFRVSDFQSKEQVRLSDFQRQEFKRRSDFFLANWGWKRTEKGWAREHTWFESQTKQFSVFERMQSKRDLRIYHDC